MPVGSVMAWPSNSTPTSGGVWLECNGQAIPSQYKKLREIMGDKTPNYAGVFLRGYGSQTATANQGFVVGDKQQKYSSGALGQVQADAARPIHFGAPDLLIRDHDDWSNLNRTYSGPAYLGAWRMSNWSGGGIAPDSTPYGDGSGAYVTSCAGFSIRNIERVWRDHQWMLKRPPKRYSVNGNSVREYDDYDSGQYVNYWATMWAGWSEASVPAASEIRPVNIAVRYFVKAR